MELPRQQHTASMNGHGHGAPGHAHPHHHRQTSSNGGSGFHPTEKTALMNQARSAYRLNDVEASRCGR